MSKILFITGQIIVLIIIMGFGGSDFFTTIQKSFFYQDESVNIALKYKNTNRDMQIVSFRSECHSSFRIYNDKMQQVYPLSRDEVKCVNFSKKFVALAPNQNLVFRLSVDADMLPTGKYFIQGLVSGFRPGQLVGFEVLKKPIIDSDLGKPCGTAVNKACGFGLTCSYENSSIVNLGVCVNSGTNLATSGVAQRNSVPVLSANVNSIDKLQINQKFDNLQVSKLDNLEYFSSDPLSVTEFKELVFNKTFQKIDVADSQNLLTKQLAAYVLYFYLYSKKTPMSLSGMFFLDTIGSKYVDYIDACASLGVISMKDKYFYPYDLVTRGEVVSMIDKFLAL